MTDTSTDDDMGMTAEDALFDFATMRAEDRDALKHRENVHAGARLAKHNPDQFKALLKALGDWPSTRNFRNKVDALIAQSEDLRPKIADSGTDLKGTLDETEKALMGAANLFQTMGRLVQVVRYNNAPAEDCTEEEIIDPQKTPVRRPDGALVVEDINDHRLVELITTVARWYKWDKRAKSRDPNPDEPGAYVRSKPSLEIAKHIKARGQWPFKVIRGSIRAPILRSTGSILQRSGYDRRSQLYFDNHDGMEFPPIPDQPTRDDALAALNTLKDPIQYFPFVPDDGEEAGGRSAARSVAISAMLTALNRRTMQTAPAHAFDAPVMSTGKTKLCEIAAVLATGRTPTAMSQGSTPEEFNKRLFSVLRTGDPIILIDNIEREIESDELCSILTSPVWQNRVLGESRSETVETNALIMLNGNRMTFKGDITVRVVMCHIDAEMEQPRDRKFPWEPVSRALENRADLVVAGLTILRAHAVAGFPGAEGLTPSRFPDWDRMIRGALVWLSEPDPQVTAEKIITEDPVRDTHSALLRALQNSVGVGVPVTAKQVIERSMAETDEEIGKFEWPSDTPWPDDAAKTLRDAIEGALESKFPTPRGLSDYLKKFEGRIYDGLSIQSRDDRHNKVRAYTLRKSSR